MGLTSVLDFKNTAVTIQGENAKVSLASKIWSLHHRDAKHDALIN